MAKGPDRPHAPKGRDPAKHSKKDPAKPTRSKAARPDTPVLDPTLADLLNPAIGQGRAGVGSQTGIERTPSPSSPSPLVGEGGVGGREGKSRVATGAHEVRPRLRPPSRPPPLTPPHKGEGKSKPPSSRPRRTIPLTAAPTSPTRTGHARPSCAVSARPHSRAISARRRFRPANSIPTSPAHSASTRRKAPPRKIRGTSLRPTWARPDCASRDRARATSARSPASPVSNRSTGCCAKAARNSAKAKGQIKSGCRTGRSGRKRARAAGPWSSNPISTPRAISRKPSPTWSKACAAMIAARCCSASPAPARRSPWPR